MTRSEAEACAVGPEGTRDAGTSDPTSNLEQLNNRQKPIIETSFRGASPLSLKRAYLEGRLALVSEAMKGQIGPLLRRMLARRGHHPSVTAASRGPVPSIGREAQEPTCVEAQQFAAEIFLYRRSDCLEVLDPSFQVVVRRELERFQDLPRDWGVEDALDAIGEARDL